MCSTQSGLLAARSTTYGVTSRGVASYIRWVALARLRVGPPWPVVMNCAYTEGTVRWAETVTDRRTQRLTKIMSEENGAYYSQLSINFVNKWIWTNTFIVVARMIMPIGRPVKRMMQRVMTRFYARTRFHPGSSQWTSLTVSWMCLELEIPNFREKINAWIAIDNVSRNSCKKWPDGRRVWPDHCSVVHCMQPVRALNSTQFSWQRSTGSHC